MVVVNASPYGTCAKMKGGVSGVRGKASMIWGKHGSPPLLIKTCGHSVETGEE